MRIKSLSSLREKIWQSMPGQILRWQWRISRPVDMRLLEGFILNRRNVAREEEKVKELADDFKTQVIGTLSHSELVAEAEEEGKTVMECFPGSEMAEDIESLRK